MSLGAHHHAWLPPGHLRPPDDHHHDGNASPSPRRTMSSNSLAGFRSSSRPRTPNPPHNARSRAVSQSANPVDPDAAINEDPKFAVFRELYRASEARIAALFGPNGETREYDFLAHTALDIPGSGHATDAVNGVGGHAGALGTNAPSSQPISRKRKLEEDDYDDYDDDDDEDEIAAPVVAASPLSGKVPDNSASFNTASTSFSAAASRPTPPKTSSSIDSAKDAGAASQDKAKTAEEIRKKLEEDKKAMEDEVKKSFNTMFYTLENDRDAMLDQQRLEESERQLEAEMSSQGQAPGNTANTAEQPGTLSSANLGASSLTLMNLIARIDQKRGMVQASDAELRSLISEVRKNRSKWANQDKVGQEELYEACEKVLNELKASTEHSTAFLTRVNKRDAPDYYSIIKNPMDLGTMTKRLKSIHYKSKKEFVDDLNLIWSNCLRYNSSPEHVLRKHALFMRKQTEKLVPLIPDIVIRDRAEVEAEERRAQLAENDMDGAEESDDEPIMSSRGRKAPGKKAKKGTNEDEGRSATPGKAGDGTPVPDVKPPVQNLLSNIQRADSDAAMDGSQNGFATPPPGFGTPGTGTVTGHGDVDDGFGSGSMNGVLASVNEYEDPAFKVWKQVTKKDRAVHAADRHRLFESDKLNPEEPALLRTRAGMRRFLRNQKLALLDGSDSQQMEGEAKEADAIIGETLAEGIEDEQERMLPDYYDSTSGVPDLSTRVQWIEDSEGNIIDHNEEDLKIVPKGSFTAPVSKLTTKMAANMRQMQETRKICAKIGIVKQMQLQAQMYQNQFQKYQVEPFVEKDIETHVMKGDGPVLDPAASRAALQRSVAEIFYHAGFEEYQPSALEAITDLAGDYFRKIAGTFKSYSEAPQIAVESVENAESVAEIQWRNPYTKEQIILHTLSAAGTDLDALETYVKDDVDRLGTKLGVIHERMKAHLAELLRPALQEGGADGSQAFNDGSEQFVGGDFAEDIDEDFFGFKELGLAQEFGMSQLSVPLHLLQNRMYRAANPQNAAATTTADQLFPEPTPYPRISYENLDSQIQLVKTFFAAKLTKSNDEPLVEDLDLPPKQRPGVHRPRLPASGKIPGPTAGSGSGNNTSPQKKPPPPPTFAKPNGTASSSSNAANGTAASAASDGPAKKKAKKAATPSTTDETTSTPAKSGLKIKLAASKSDKDKDKDPAKDVRKNSTASVTNASADVDAAGDADGDFEDANGELDDTAMGGMDSHANGMVNGTNGLVSPKGVKT